MSSQELSSVNENTSLIQKFKFYTILDHYENKVYSWWQNVCAIVEYAWVLTYHKYYDTEKYHIWMECLEFVEKRKNEREQ